MHWFKQMKDIFKDIKEIKPYLSNEEECLKFIAGQKWRDGFVCRKCGHSNYCSGKRPYSRRCTRCKTEESATAHTIFHRCHIPLTEAFKIIHLVCNNPQVSSYEISRELDRRQMTCWKFKKKVMDCLESNGEFSITAGNH